MPPVRIERIAAGGDGVGRLEDGRTLFVPRTAPGDLIEPQGVRVRARYASARIGRLLEPGPDRVEPGCAHYVEDDCGGCQLQHLSPSAQRDARRQIAGDALRRIGKIETGDPPLDPADREWGYRDRITLSRSPDGRRAGFHQVDAPGSVFELRRCEIAVAALNDLIPALRKARAALPAGIRKITLRIDDGSRLHLILRGPVRPGGTALRRWTSAFPGLPIVSWWHPRPGVTRLLAGDPAGISPAGAFEQVHREMGDRVRREAVERLGLLAGRRAWDLYAGLGEASSLLADRGAMVESVELDKEAVAAADRRDGRASIRRHAGRVENWITRLSEPHAVYANPPRSGLGPGVTAALRARAPERIAYVSCDPATLGRDLALLCHSSGSEDPVYTVAWIRAFDLFPQTAHVETVVALERWRA